jgi:hypothetical protein
MPDDLGLTAERPSLPQALVRGGPDPFDDPHGARCHMKCCFSSRSTATRDIVSPVFEGLWPSLLDVILPEAFPLAIINFFQPILDGRLNTR